MRGAGPANRALGALAPTLWLPGHELGENGQARAFATSLQRWRGSGGKPAPLPLYYGLDYRKDPALGLGDRATRAVASSDYCRGRSALEGAWLHNERRRRENLPARQSDPRLRALRPQALTTGRDMT